MKDVTIGELRHVLRIPIDGRPLQGWAVKYVSGIPNGRHIEPGFYLCHWVELSNSLEFAFDKKSEMAFSEEVRAKAVSTFLKEKMDIETEIVKIG